jgi:hypothetical protein
VKDKKFDAILAKNEIAREVAKATTEGISVSFVEFQLRIIEKYLGTANQPTVSEIVANNTDENKQFNI